MWALCPEKGTGDSGLESQASGFKSTAAITLLSRMESVVLPPSQEEKARFRGPIEKRPRNVPSSKMASKKRGGEVKWKA